MSNATALNFYCVSRGSSRADTTLLARASVRGACRSSERHGVVSLRLARRAP